MRPPHMVARSLQPEDLLQADTTLLSSTLAQGSCRTHSVLGVPLHTGPVSWGGCPFPPRKGEGGEEGNYPPLWEVRVGKRSPCWLCAAGRTGQSIQQRLVLKMPGLSILNDQHCFLSCFQGAQGPTPAERRPGPPKPCGMTSNAPLFAGKRSN